MFYYYYCYYLYIYIFIYLHKLKTLAYYNRSLLSIYLSISIYYYSFIVVIFATYYQSVLVLLLTQKSNGISAEDASRYNNILICIEMVFFSIGLIIAFPISEFLGKYKNQSYY